MRVSVPRRGDIPSSEFFHTLAPVDDQLRTVISFKDHIPLDLENLRRIAPIATAGRHAIVVAEHQSSRYMTRLITLNNPQDVAALGRPEFWVSTGPPTGLMISVNGPGDLRVTQEPVTVIMRARIVHELGPVSSVPGVRDWIDEVSVNLHGKIVWPNPLFASDFGGAGGFRNFL